MRTATKSTTTDGAAEEQDFRGVAVERKAVNEVGRGDGCVVPPPKRRRKEGGVVGRWCGVEPSPSRLCEECLTYIICELSVRWKN